MKRLFAVAAVCLVLCGIVGFQHAERQEAREQLMKVIEEQLGGKNPIEVTILEVGNKIVLRGYPKELNGGLLEIVSPNELPNGRAHHYVDVNSISVLTVEKSR